MSSVLIAKLSILKGPPNAGVFWQFPLNKIMEETRWLDAPPHACVTAVSIRMQRSCHASSVTSGAHDVKYG